MISMIAEKVRTAASGTIPPRYFARKIFLRLRPSEKMTLPCFLLCANLNRTVAEMIAKIIVIITTSIMLEKCCPRNIRICCNSCIR